MPDLRPIEGSELNEYVINLLHKNNINTVIEFLTFDENKLSKITNLPETQIIALKVKIRRIHGPQVVDALHFCSPICRVKFTTGIESLDLLLGDEFLPGRIYEICGYSSAGKSLLCTTIALNFVQNHAAEVLFLDTKRDFSATQLNRMISARGVQKDEVGRIMQMIKVERCYNLKGVINILEKLMESLRQKKTGFKLLIIDSLPAVWYLFHGEDGSRKGKSLLTKCACFLKQIAKEYKLLVICVNVMVRSISEEDPFSAMDVEDRIDFVERVKQPSDQYTMSSSSKPSLGKCWDGVPTIRLCLEDPFYEAMINEVSSNRTLSDHNSIKGMDKNQRIVKIMKSCFTSTGTECTIRANDTGIY